MATAASSSSSRCSSSTWPFYDLLGASQEHRIKPKKFPQTDIDEVIIGHTNEPEYKKLQNNEFMEALRDRTVKIDIPTFSKLTRSEDLREGLQSHKIRGSTSRRTRWRWRRCGRAHPARGAEEAQPDGSWQKLKLYNGKTLPASPGQHEGAAQGKRTGRAWRGSARGTCRTKISNALVSDKGEGCATPSWCSTS